MTRARTTLGPASRPLRGVLPDPGVTTHPDVIGPGALVPLVQSLAPAAALTAPRGAFTTTGTWTPGSLGELTASTAGALAVLRFSGTYVELHALTGPGAGSLAVSVDGGATTTVSLAADAPALAVVFTRTGLTVGQHTLTVEHAGGGPAGVQSARVNAYTHRPASDPAPSNVLWTTDLTAATVQDAFGWNQVDGTAQRNTYASLVSDPSFAATGGRALQLRLPANNAAHDGYRAMLALQQNAVPGFPATNSYLEYDVKVTNLGGMVTNRDAKTGYGLAGAPTGVTMSGIGSGGDLDPGTWYVRPTLSGTSDSPVPGALCWGSYVYAVRFGSRTFVAGGYGLRHLWRYPDGTYVTARPGRVERVRLEIREGTPGTFTGRLRVLFNGVLVQDEPVQWVADGLARATTHLLVQHFANDAFADGATFRYSPPVVGSL